MKIHKAMTKQKERRNKCKISGNHDIFLFSNTQNRKTAARNRRLEEIPIN